MQRQELANVIQEAFNRRREAVEAKREEVKTQALAERKVEIQAEPAVDCMIKGNWQFRGDDGKIYKVNLQQKAFAEAYVGECNGNGVCAVYKAGYKVKSARVAASMASEYLILPNIYAYLNKLLDVGGFNDENVDRQHLFLINQHGDMKTKAKAIDMYNRLRARYPKEAGGDIPAVGYFSLADLAEKAVRAERAGVYNPEEGKVISVQDGK